MPTRHFHYKSLDTYDTVCRRLIFQSRLGLGPRLLAATRAESRADAGPRTPATRRAFLHSLKEAPTLLLSILRHYELSRRLDDAGGLIDAD